jgi:hypothetical protein
MKIPTIRQRLCIRLLVQVIVCIGFCYNAGAISGPVFVRPGVPATYAIGVPSGAWVYSQTWSVNSANSSIFLYGNQATLSVSKLETQCKIMIRCIYKWQTQQDYYGPDTAYLEVTVLPFISPVASINPGYSTTFTLQDNCGNIVCNNLAWSVAPAALCPAPCNITGNSFTITCPPTGYPANATIYLNLTCSGQSSASISQSVPVKLKKPQIAGGASYIGCPGVPLAPYSYTIPQILGSTSYQWTYPPFMSFVSYTNNNQTLNLLPTGTGVGWITAQAIGGGINSDRDSFRVEVCCVPSFELVDTVFPNNTHNVEAGHFIKAMNPVLTTATASYHANDYVQLAPGFSAEAGSYFHAYIQGCTGSFFKTLPADNPGADEHPQLSGTTWEEKKSILPAEVSRVRIYPNPNNGRFTLQFDNSEKRHVKIVGLLGNTLFEQDDAGTNDTYIDMSGYSDGIYFVHVEYAGTRVTERIMLQK